MTHLCKAWDKLPWMEFERLDRIRERGETDDAVRCRVRIQAAEDALERARSDPFAALFAFHDDLDRRRTRWAHLHSARRSSRRRMLVATIGVVLGAGAGIALMIALQSVFGLFALLIVAPFVLTERTALEGETFDEHRCPDCEYDLTGVPASIPVERLRLYAGPHACPECGAAWPLVPPPA